jgi:hypothetical protein
VVIIDQIGGVYLFAIKVEVQMEPNIYMRRIAALHQVQYPIPDRPSIDVMSL